MLNAQECYFLSRQTIALASEKKIEDINLTTIIIRYQNRFPEGGENRREGNPFKFLPPARPNFSKLMEKESEDD